jgi:DNA-binding NarL/FixJ family response regulator
MKSIRILLVEDNRILREGLAATIDAQTDMKVVATVGSGNNIVEKAQKAKPSVILFDISLKNLSDLSVIELLVGKCPDSKVIGMGLVPTQADIVEFITAGASGFILKDATVKEFLKTVRTVADGSKVLPLQLTGSLFAHVVEQALKRGKGHIAQAIRMTKREREILVHVADGMSNKEIAEHLNLAVATVKSHIHNIMEKLALHSRLQIAQYSREEEKPPS